MIRKRDVPLKIELLSEGEDSRFTIHSRGEIQSILKGIMRENSRAALYYDEGDDFILTTMLKASDQGIWLEVGPISTSNQRILFSKKIIFISSYHQVKVQFVANHIESAILDNYSAFHIPFPEKLLRIQRREYFRLTTPASNPLKCIIPCSPHIITYESGVAITKRELTIMDISGGGIALVCEVDDTTLHPGKSYEGCKIQLPDIGLISATVKVQNSFEVTLRNGQRSKRAGCEFIDLSGEAATLLQRYVVKLQSEVTR
jgi:c-di-GMP-binding flagellar brake protein YcgR